MSAKLHVKGFDAAWAEDLAEMINDFLEDNDVEVVDIKHSSSYRDSGGTLTYNTALLIYKDK